MTWAPLSGFLGPSEHCSWSHTNVTFTSLSATY